MPTETISDDTAIYLCDMSRCEANNVWAVLNYNGEFAVPEPSTALSLLAIGTLAICRRRGRQ